MDLTTTPPTLQTVYSGGSRSDVAAVDANGCLYATQSDRVLKITNASAAP